MPGTTITVGVSASLSASSKSPASTYFVAGQAERGPADKAMPVNGLAEFMTIYGGATTYGALYTDVRTFFEEGGTRAYVARVVGAAATTGTLSTPLQDSGATPAPTLTVAATSPGAWSARVSVRPLAGATAATWRLQVLLDGRIVEDYGNLKSPSDAVSRLNDGPSASAYIRVTSAGSAAVAPANNPAPLSDPVTLGAGADDLASIVATSYTDALELFNDDLSDGAVAIPGMGSAVHEKLILHANTHNRLALLASELGNDKAELLGQAAVLDAPRAGLFAPWIKVPDGQGGTKVISPEGYVAACRARAHDQAGPWRAPAGEVAKARRVIAPDQVFATEDSRELDAGKVNVILTRAASVRLYGWRSLSADTDNWKMLSYADVVNRVVTECARRIEPYVFAAIDGRGHLLSAIAGTLEGIVKPLADLGGLFPWVEDTESGPVMIDPGYKVVTGSELNTRASMANDEVRGQVIIRPAPTAATVLLTVNKASVTAAL